MGADHAIHPLRQAAFEQAKVLAVLLGRGRLFKLSRMNSRYHGMAVILIQTRPNQRIQFCFHAFENACKRAGLPRQCACQGSIKHDAFGFEIFTQTLCLLVTQRAEHIVIISAK